LNSIHSARRSGHLSRHERQRRARAEAFSRRTTTSGAAPLQVTLAPEDLSLIDRLVRHDRTTVSTALLAIAGIGAGRPVRSVVLARVTEVACWAQAEGAISLERAEQIARHVKRADGPQDRALAA
jgi:hypothetical protein